MSPYPPAPRVFAAVAAVLLGAWFGGLQAASFLLSGCVAAAVAVAACAGLAVLFLGLVAFAPAAVDRLLRGRTRLDLRDAGHAGALVVMVAALFFLLGWGAVVSATATVEEAFGGCSLTAPGPINGTDILQAVTIQFAIFTLPVLLYVGFVHGGGPGGALRTLGVKQEGAGRAVLAGVVMAVLFLALLAGAAALLARFLPEEALQNDAALEIARSVTVAGAFALSAASSVGEEIFFRGFLQPRVGNLATSLFFALAHFSYGSVSEVVVVLALSLALGLLFKRTGNLLAPIATHFTFNLINLLAGLQTPT